MAPAVPDPEQALPLAEAAAIDLGKGFWARAELTARASLALAPNAVAENVLGKLAMDVGRPEIAVPAFERALGLDSRFKPAVRNLAAARRRLEERARVPAVDQPGRADRFLLIRGWGYGFWADVDHVIGALLLAEITGRTPIVFWGRESLWADVDQSAGDAGQRPSSAWEAYFEPVSPARIADVESAAKEGGVYPPKWAPGTLREPPASRWEGAWSRVPALRLFNRSERVVVSDFHVAVAGLLPWVPMGHRLHGADFATAHRDLFSRWLRPRSEIAGAAEAFVREHLPGAPEQALAVHIRGTDKAIESAHLERVSEEYPRRIEAILAREPGLRIFLMTDDAGARQRLESRFGGRVVCADAARSSGSTGVHYLKHESRTRLGIEVLRDVLIAARCGRLIGLGSSNVTLAAWHMKAWPEGAVELLDVPLHSYVSPVLFERS
ncbi:MAG: hypothetical protein AB7K52_11605 [Phycisphaerales bacterium]